MVGVGVCVISYTTKATEAVTSSLNTTPIHTTTKPKTHFSTSLTWLGSNRVRSRLRSSEVCFGFVYACVGGWVGMKGGGEWHSPSRVLIQQCTSEIQQPHIHIHITSTKHAKTKTRALAGVAMAAPRSRRRDWMILSGPRRPFRALFCAEGVFGWLVGLVGLTVVLERARLWTHP